MKFLLPLGRPFQRLPRFWILSSNMDQTNIWDEVKVDWCLALCPWPAINQRLSTLLSSTNMLPDSDAKSMAYNCDTMLVCTSDVHTKGGYDHRSERCDCRSPEKLFILLGLNYPNGTAQSSQIVKHNQDEIMEHAVFYLTIYLVARRNAKKDAPTNIVCQFHWINNPRLLGEVHNAKEALELLKSNGDGGTRHETDDGGMRQELYDKS